MALLQATPPPDLLQRALDPNPALKSYIASARLTAQLQRGLPISKVFTGTDYYDRPNQKIVFDNATGVFSSFRELTTTLPTEESLLTDYQIASHSDDGAHSQFVMNRRSADGRVRSITFTVDDKTALLDTVLWTYSDGSSLSIQPVAYMTVGSYRLPTSEEIRADFTLYQVDGTLQLWNYRSLRASTGAK